MVVTVMQTRAWLALSAALAAASIAAPPLSRGTPDLRMMQGLANALRPQPQATSGPPQIPVLPSRRDRLPNVLLVMTEGVRADVACRGCEATPRVDALLPNRVQYSEMRAVATFTVVTMSALTTGRSQVVGRDEVLSMPSLFDYVKAAQAGGVSPATAYWSAHCHPMFERQDIKRSIDSYVTAEDLLGDQEWHEDADERLVELFAQKLPTLPRPFFVVLHLVNTHTPYAVDPENAPFVPWERDFTWEGMPRLFNTYRNAVRKQDRVLARALEPLIAGPEAKDTLVLYTSDHGEEFGEHKQIHHGQNVLDTQLRVPAWFSAGARALTPEQATWLERNAGAFATHLDVLPTLLDAYGVLDSYELSAFRGRFEGRSLLRALAPQQPIPITSCTETFPCPFRNAGMLREGWKIEAQAWDPGWNCWNLEGGKEQPASLDLPPCRALIESSRRYFPQLPCGQPNR